MNANRLYEYFLKGIMKFWKKRSIVPEILFIESGQQHDKIINQLEYKNLKKISIIDLPNVNLMKYDIMIVPSFSNQDVLSRIKSKIENFICYGGILVIFRASTGKNDWIPLCTYFPRHLEKVKFVNTDTKAAKIIFNGLSLEENVFKFHNKFIAHGYFTSDNKNCLPLITGEKDEIVMGIIQADRWKGKMLITTLDPDHHSVSGYPKEGMEFNNNAKTLFHNIINWTIEESKQENIGRKMVRKFRGLLDLSKRFFVSIFISIISIICLCLVLFYFLGIISEKELGAFAAISSVFSLVLSIWEIKRNRPLIE